MINPIKISCFLFLFTICSSKSFGQIEQGTFIIDPYIGVPGERLLTKFNFAFEDYTYTGWPMSLGIRGEYMFTDYIGVGIDANYSNYGYEYIIEGAYYNGVTQTFHDAHYEFQGNTFRFMLRANYHLIRTSNLDAYIGGGVGGRDINTKTLVDGKQTSSTNLYIPVAFRLAVGGHFYFTENIGIHAEAGISGGGFVQGGLAIKF